MNLKQHQFVTEYLKWGDAALAYKNAYNTHSDNYRAIESAANRLLKKPEIAAAIEEAQARIRADAEAEVRAKLSSELLTVQRKREILARIAEGNIYIEQQYKGGGCKTCTQMVKPSIDQMLKAIDLDSRLAGDYPVRKQITVVHTIAEKIGLELSENPMLITECTKSARKDATKWEELVTQMQLITQAGLHKLLSKSITLQQET